MIFKKPKLWPTVFTIPALLLLFSLSIWQFKRMAWKENLIAQVNEQGKLPAIDLPSVVVLEKMIYRKVKIRGKFIHEKELHLYGGSRQFKGKNGYFILTPLETIDNKIILINRGWVVETKKNSHTRPETLVTGEVEVEGAIMKSETRPLYVHDNQPDKNIWFFINLAEIKQYLNLPIDDFYIMAKDTPNESPRGKDLNPKMHNNHLTYALTWLFSAIILIIIYIRFHQISEE